MGWLGKLFGTSDAVKEIIDAGARIADEFHYSDEEKAEDKAAATTEARRMVLEWMANTQGQNLSRRIIALSITGTWLLTHMISTSFAFGAIWAGKRQEQMVDSSALLDARLDGMTGAVMLILGFYFAAPYMGDIAKGALDRFGGKRNG